MDKGFYALIVSTFIIITTIYLKKNNIKNRLLTILSIYLFLGVCLPSIFWICSPLSKVRNIHVVDEQGKPIKDAGIIIYSSYKIGHVEFTFDEYKIIARLSDVNGNAEIPRFFRPLPIILIPFFTRIDSGVACMIYKSGYYPLMLNNDLIRKNIEVKLINANDEDKLYNLFKDYQYVHYKNIDHFFDDNSIKIYSGMYKSMVGDLTNISKYDIRLQTINFYMNELNEININIGRREQR